MRVVRHRVRPHRPRGRVAIQGHPGAATSAYREPPKHVVSGHPMKSVAIWTVVLFSALMSSSGCRGERGDKGDTGPPGPSGPRGSGGASTGQSNARTAAICGTPAGCQGAAAQHIAGAPAQCSASSDTGTCSLAGPAGGCDVCRISGLITTGRCSQFGCTCPAGTIRIAGGAAPCTATADQGACSLPGPTGACCICAN